MLITKPKFLSLIVIITIRTTHPGWDSSQTSLNTFNVMIDEPMSTQHYTAKSNMITNIAENHSKNFKEGVHQFYKFVLKCKVRYTVTAVICDFPQICFYTARQLFRFPGTGSPGTQSWFSGTQSRVSGNTI